ncbi:MAG: DNA mismatch repair protein MutS [Chitinophagaceae bacterium]|nr:DNA mismatch repair protein MutS [Chitinophagaceae bacterium]
MNIDQTTLQDLAIFHADEDQSVLNKLDFTQTIGGRHYLVHLLSHPHQQLPLILETQQTLQLVGNKLDQWPSQISNGTIMVLEKFYESQIDRIPFQPTPVGALAYKLFHGPDYSLVRYTVGHATEFLKGMQQLLHLFSSAGAPPLLQKKLDRIANLLQKDTARQMLQAPSKEQISPATSLNWGYFLHNRYKAAIFELIDIFSQLDAYYSLAKAVQVYQLRFPEFTTSPTPIMNAEGLWHILLKQPVTYELSLHLESNFIFLTGANMAGKSTFIRAVGIASYLAHLGMAVPARRLQLTVFDGILSNIQVSDNIIKGESYFFNEVQRIKNTLTRINDGGKWLVLIDELFKGTNVQDAMRCSSTVIKGLLKISNSLFVLSTHLYEIAEELKPHANIAFRFFETHVHDDQLFFSYQLKEGISNDRLGYLILKREGVVEMIDRL